MTECGNPFGIPTFPRLRRRDQGFRSNGEDQPWNLAEASPPYGTVMDVRSTVGSEFGVAIRSVGLGPRGER
jgi:hypothetical protein